MILIVSSSLNTSNEDGELIKIFDLILGETFLYLTLLHDIKEIIRIKYILDKFLVLLFNSINS